MQTEQQKKKRKIVSAVGAGVLAVAIVLTGTYAWQSISQKALNETDGVINPGGRLHDDFNGRNKDIYVENFTDPDKGGVPIYIRVRLDEYMEIGPDAGKKVIPDGEVKDAVSLVEGADINDFSTWSTHKPTAGGTADECDGGAETFHKYWGWDMGGQTVFIPTFNKNKDSLKADINGTRAGADGDPAAGEAYDDYVQYTNGQKLTGDAVYDADKDDEDEENPVEGTDITIVKEEHTAQETQEAQVITMAQWRAMGEPIGRFWVYDTDGWAYWAEGLEPREATGLLLDGINLNLTPSQNWYYGINVVGQFATRGDWGQKDNTGFYDPSQGTAPTEDGLYLLNKIADLLPKVTGLTIVGGETFYVKPGGSITLQTNVKLVNGTDDPAEKEVSWAINPEMDETIFKDGSFTPTDAMEGETYQVTATSAYDPTYSASAKIYVYPKESVGIIQGQDGKMYVDYGDNTFKEILENNILGEFVCAGMDETIGNEDDTTSVVVVNPADETYGGKFIGPDYDYGYWAPGNDGKLGTADDVKVWGDPWPVNISETQPTDKIADKVTVTAAENKNSIKPGGTLQFSAVVSLNGIAIEHGNVNWSVSGATKAGTKISDTGLLTIAQDETAGAMITVKATSLAAHGVSGEATVKVIPEGLAGINVIDPNTSYVATIDGIEWYVLAKDGNNAMLWSKEMIPEWGTRVFGSNNNWKNSTAETWLNGDFLNSLPTIKFSAVETQIYTRSQYSASTWVETNNKIFLLSEADLFGSHSGSATSEPKDYTYKGKMLVTNMELLKCSNSIAPTSYLRSPRRSTYYVTTLGYEGTADYGNYNLFHSVRPAMWVTYK